MNQGTKERIIGKIRTSSFVIGIFCVLLIAVLLLLKAIIPTAILAADIGSGIKGMLSLLGDSSLLESVLFLFAALIMHYASLLQQESDETL